MNWEILNPDFDNWHFRPKHRRTVMKLSELPLNTMFVVLHPGELAPIHHKGDDGIVRKVLGSWQHGHRTVELTIREKMAFTCDIEVQPVFIPAPQFPD